MRAAVVVAAVTAAAGALAGPAAAATQNPTVPSAPQNVRVVGIADGRIDLTWSAPASTGGRPVHSYRITELNSGETDVVTGKVRTDRFTKVTNLAPARFVVEAINAVGASEPSDPTDTTHAKPNLLVLTTGIAEGLKPVDQAIEVGVRVPNAAAMDIRVRTLDSGRAKSGKDFDALDTVVTLPAGARSVSVPVRLRDDTKIEGDEKLALELSSPDALRTAVTSTKILDDDASTWLYLDGAEPVTEGDTGTTPMTYGLRLSRPITTPLTVPVDVSLPDEAQLVELGALPTSVTFPAGTTSLALTVPVLGDRTVDASAQVSVQIAPPAGVTAPVVRRGSMVVDDDSASSGSGADLALSAAWATDIPQAPGVRFTIKNASKVAATGVTLSLVHTGYLLDGDTELLPDSCTYGGGFFRPGWPSGVVVHRWTCSVGDVAAGATTTVTLAPPRSGTVVAGITSQPYDDPDHSNNLATISYP